MNWVRKESCAHWWLHLASWQDGRLKQVLEVTLILLLHTFHKRLNAGLLHALSQIVSAAVWMKDTLHRFMCSPLVTSWWAAWKVVEPWRCIALWEEVNHESRVVLMLPNCSPTSGLLSLPDSKHNANGSSFSALRKWYALKLYVKEQNQTSSTFLLQTACIMWLSS